MLKKILFSLLTCALAAAPAFAQSQAANGAIEGTVTDSSGAVLPGVTITITNLGTGTERVVATNEKGLYRAPLLPLGTYKVVGELQGFKRFEQSGITLSVGQTAVVNATLPVGAVSESVTVIANSPLLDPARIDIGHTMTDLEVHNLPLVARNPYNFALAQPGVTGIGNVEFGVPRLAANGAAMRINYQIDGNTNTEKDRAGLRLLPMSEVMIQEVKVVTTGFAPEFGQTMGMVFNAVTPSGTNSFRGEGSYLFRRRGFSAFPFFFGCGSTTPAANCPAIAANAVKPETRVDTGTAALGGPLVKNKVFFYGGWEQTRRDLSSTSLITVTPSIVTQLGLKPQPDAAPNVQTAKFKIGKGRLPGQQQPPADRALDSIPQRCAVQQRRRHQYAGPRHRLSGRDGLHGGSARLFARKQQAERAALPVRPSSSAICLEFRLGHRSGDHDYGCCRLRRSRCRARVRAMPGSTSSRTSPRSSTTSPTCARRTATSSGSTGSTSTTSGPWRRNSCTRSQPPPRILPRSPGANPLGYTSVSQVTGNLGFNMSTNVFSTFVQDDWQIKPAVKILYGVRYDLVQVSGRPCRRAARADTQLQHGPEQLRAARGRGVVGERQNGSARQHRHHVRPGDPGGIRTGAAAVRVAPGAGLHPQRHLGWRAAVSKQLWKRDRCDPIALVRRSRVHRRAYVADQRAVRALDRPGDVGIGQPDVRQGSNLPVVTNINPINPIGTLGDGRPIYSTTASAATRLDPRFNLIQQVGSIGDSTFKAVTFGFNRRLAQGLSYNLQYSFGKGLDDTPLLTQLTVQAENGRSDPSNIERDRGPNPLDMRHSFNGNVVYTSESHAANAVVRQLLGGNQVGVILQINSGLPVNISAVGDLNGDGVTADRPLFVARNSLYLPVQKVVDLRYTRWIPVRGSVRGEIIAEFKNLFNVELLSGITTSRTVDALGNPTTAIPSDPYQFTNPSGAEQRKFQLGFKVRF
jgi:hypothetical protein